MTRPSDEQVEAVARELVNNVPGAVYDGDGIGGQLRRATWDHLARVCIDREEAARAEERERCADAVCRRCREGSAYMTEEELVAYWKRYMGDEPVPDHSPYFHHIDSDYAMPCRAGPIRALLEGEPDE